MQFKVLPGTSVDRVGHRILQSEQAEFFQCYDIWKQLLVLKWNIYALKNDPKYENDFVRRKNK